MINIYSLEKEGIPFYIGKTKNNINKRLGCHRQNYGSDITIILIDQVEDNEWKYWESFYIDLFKQWGFTLLNKNKGGGGSEYCTEETKNKISQSLIGKCKGLKKKNTQNMCKPKSSTVNMKRSIETIQKLSNRRKEGSGNNISKGKLGKRKAGKPILQLDLQDNFIKEWKDAVSVCLYLGKSRKSANISSCCLGKQKSAYGYKWKYK